MTPRPPSPSARLVPWNRDTRRPGGDHPSWSAAGDGKTTSEDGPAVVVRGARHAYPGATHPVLSGVDLTIPRGGHVAVVGRSGCGKSTLLSLICGLQEPLEGFISVCGGTSPASRLAACALMPQGDSLLPWFSLVDNVAISLRNRGVRRGAARRRAGEILQEWGLAAWSHHPPDALSGGMRQRAALARALLADKPVLLADEPLGALDAMTRGELQQWLRRTLAGTAATLVMVTHDVEEALLLAEHVVVLDRPDATSPARIVTTTAGWFSDPRPREDLMAAPEFGADRAAILQALSRHRAPAPHPAQAGIG